MSSKTVFTARRKAASALKKVAHKEGVKSARKITTQKITIRGRTLNVLVTVQHPGLQRAFDAALARDDAFCIEQSVPEWRWLCHDRKPTPLWVKVGDTHVCFFRQYEEPSPFNPAGLLRPVLMHLVFPHDQYIVTS
jgi:hypothetical protein